MAQRTQAFNSIDYQLHNSCTHSEIDSEQQLYYQPSFWNSIFPEYNFKELLAETQGSLVWLGTRKSTPGALALKVTQYIQNGSSRFLHQQKEKSFLESVTLRHMVDIKELVDNQDCRLVAMECYPWTLEDLAKKVVPSSGKRYTQRHLQFVGFAFRAILRAVDQLHQLGYVHRDLKLDNFMVDSKFNVFMNDFELVTKEGTLDASLSGTIDYMPPQRLSKTRGTEPTRQTSDIWALGIILYQLLTGETPYRGDNPEELINDIYYRRVSNDNIPAETMAFIKSMLQIKAEDRLQLQQIKERKVLRECLNKQVLKNIMKN